MGASGVGGYARDPDFYVNGEDKTPSLAIRDTVCDDDGAESDDEEENFKLRLKLLLAERKNHDLELKMAEMAVVDRALRARVRELEAGGVTGIPSSLAADEELLACNRALALAQEQSRDAVNLKEKLSQLQVTINTLVDERDQLRLELHESKASSGSTSYQQALIDELKAKNATLITRNEFFANANYDLNGKHFASTKAAEKSAEDAHFARIKLDNMERILEDVRRENSVLRDHGEILRSRVVNDPDTRVNEQASETASMKRLKSENIELKEDMKKPETDASQLKYDMAIWITELDLANAGFRTFDCTHADMHNVAKDLKSTREYNAGFLADEMFSLWCEDEGFIQVYNQQRKGHLIHHRAHERVNDAGRSVASWRMKREFNKLDEKRGVAVTYK